VKTRREFLIAGGAGLCALAPLASMAQEKGKVWRIGFFYNGARQSAIDTGRYPAFLQGMRELGYIEGRDFVIVARFAEGGEVQRLPGLATELVRAPVDVIVSSGASAAQALKQATSTVPVVFAVTNDPVGEGLVASLARPSGISRAWPRSSATSSPSMSRCWNSPSPSSPVLRHWPIHATLPIRSC
jgi:putative tryptophan/tyrosine transport system substrate-binding protein